MKLGIIVVYVLNVILFAECKLRDGTDKSSEEHSASNESVENRHWGKDSDHDIGSGKTAKDADNMDKKESDQYKKSQDKERNVQLEREMAAGSVADVLAPNQHYSINTLFKDLGRRFVPEYPYYQKEKQEMEDKNAEDYLHKAIQEKMQHSIEDKKLLPVKASPEFVLAVARQSKALEDARPVNPADELITKESLRTGDYWNAVWKEELPAFNEKTLRTDTKNHQRKDKVVPLPKLGSVRTKIMPGTKLYQLISVLKQISPRFLYVMNVE